MKQNNKNEIAPIFITGSVRSGTSIINRAIKQSTDIPGFDEGCFIDFLGIFLQKIDARYNNRITQRQSADLMLNDVNYLEFRDSFCSWFLGQYKKYLRYDGVFIDKTPNIEVLYSVPDIISFLPSSKFIFMKRRSIENLISRIKKFPLISFERHCELWTETMEAIKTLKNDLPKESFILIDQCDISTKSEEVARKIGLFLNLNFEQIKNMEKIFIGERPEFSGGDESNFKSLEEIDWTDEQRKLFLKICGPMTNEFGWSLDKNYYKN